MEGKEIKKGTLTTEMVTFMISLITICIRLIL